MTALAVSISWYDGNLFVKNSKTASFFDLGRLTVNPSISIFEPAGSARGKQRADTALKREQREALSAP